jgi:mannose-6-phosphate isomerase-like protein (cupin superfamily)
MIEKPRGPEVIRRPMRRAQRIALTGRSVRTLATPEDGIGDVTVTVAHIAPGRMNAHRHGPGGEVMFIPRGRGVLWVEGLPIPLRPRTAAVATEGALHNAENTGSASLVVIGIFCPAAVPGSYGEEPPCFSATGVIASVDDLHRRVQRGSLPAGTGWSSEPVIDDPKLSPNVVLRVVRLAPGTRVTLGTRGDPTNTRAWVTIRGGGRVVGPVSAAGPIVVHDLVAAGPGGAPVIEAGPRGLSFVEFEAAPSRG